MRATALLELVGRLLAHETGGDQSQQAMVEATERACEKLRVHLSVRVGQDGYRALLSRAVALATAQFPSLSTVHVGENGTLEGLPEAHPESFDASVSLLAQLFALLITFIGEDLTLRMVHAIWPALLPEPTPSTPVASNTSASISNQGEDVLGEEDVL